MLNNATSLTTGKNCESGIIDAAAHGKNLRRHWHTFGLEWTSSRLSYYIDGKQVWSTTRGVSTSNEQALMLTIEYDQGPGDAWDPIRTSMTRRNYPTECLSTMSASMKGTSCEFYPLPMLAAA